MSNFNPSNVPSFLQQFLQHNPQANSFQPEPQPFARQGGGIRAYEISNKTEIEYIEPDKSGQLVFLYCQPEKRVYIGRYNHIRQEMDYESFMSEGDAKLFQKPDNSAEMGKLVDALVLMANKLDGMHGDIQELKTKKPAVKKQAKPKEADE